MNGKPNIKKVLMIDGLIDLIDLLKTISIFGRSSAVARLTTAFTIILVLGKKSFIS